jgi:hypothetical protein
MRLYLSYDRRFIKLVYIVFFPLLFSSLFFPTILNINTHNILKSSSFYLVSTIRGMLGSVLKLFSPAFLLKLNPRYQGKEHKLKRIKGEKKRMLRRRGRLTG